MRKIISIILFSAVCQAAVAQAVTTWSVGAVNVDCASSQICFPIMVETNTANTQLSFVTLRFLYDNALMSGLTIQGEENGYTITLQQETTPTVGAEFGFTTTTAAFPRISITPNLTNYLDINVGVPTHVYDMCFNVTENPVPPQLCTPLVFDYNHTAAAGIQNDAGYFVGDGGIATQYVENSTGNAIAADDDAVNYLWIGDPDFVHPLDTPGETVGSTQTTSCLSTGCVLPVELLSFRAKPRGRTAVLDWSTATEINNDFFEVQRSHDTRNFEAIGVVKGAGTSYTIESYQFIDEHPLIGKNYYRLHQVDLDGSSEYSNIREVTFEGSRLSVEVFPNPATNYLYVRGSLGNKTSGSIQEEGTMDLYNIDGKLIRQWKLEDFNFIDETIKIKDLSPGMFVIKISVGSESMTQTFVKEARS